MNLTPPKDRPLRYRPRDGEPTCVIEHVLQWIWKWRAELMITYIAITISAVILYEVLAN